MNDFLADTTDLLGRTPAVLTALLRGLPESWTGTADTPEGWRPRDVVGHLISAEQHAWTMRAKHIFEHGASVPFHSFDRFEMLERDRDATLDELLTRFAELRAASLVELATLVSEDDLGRQGMHPSLGEVSLRELLATWSVHDLDHIGQIFAGMAGSHDADVGPWKAYLGILLRRTDPAAVAG